MTNATIKVTGKTYPARTWLKDCGLVFDKDAQAWIGDDAAKAEIDRTSTASYSRANAKLLSGLTVEQI